MHTAAVIALIASLLALSLGVVGLIDWVVRRRKSRVDSAYRADQLVAQARAEFAYSELCDTTAAAEHRAEQMADATSGYYFDAEVIR